MKREQRFNKKDLRKRLRYIMLIYMDGLKGKKKDKFSNYLDDKLAATVDYYVSLLKKKKRKNLSLPALPPDLLVDQLMDIPKTKDSGQTGDRQTGLTAPV